MAAIDDLSMNRVLDSRVSEKSRDLYEGKLSHFFYYLWERKGQEGLPEEPFHEEFVLRVTSCASFDANDVAAIKTVVRKEARACMRAKRPVLTSLEFLCPNDPHDSVVFKFILSLKHSDGGQVASRSVYETTRSAFKWLYRLSNESMPQSLDICVKEFNAGIKRVVVAEQAKGDAPLETGKRPVTFEMLEALGRKLLYSNDKESPFVFAYMLLAWNLMARAGNVATLLFQNMEIRDDAMIVLFAQMKNDKDGARKKHPRHLFPNINKPHMCVFLALAIHLMVNGSAEGSKHLFGTQQTNAVYERFQKGFKRVLEGSEDIVAMLEEMEYDVDDFGAHSFRKGAVTACLGGVLGGPSPSSVFIRAGWTLNGVESRYALFDKSGDQFLGRVAAGLPLDRVEFGAIRPHFELGAPSVRLYFFLLKILTLITGFSA